jgi:protocatechuate 3,4-dioxygenase beta subunit
LGFWRGVLGVRWRFKQIAVALVLVMCAVTLGTIPGSVSRRVMLERQAPSLPKGASGDAEVEVAAVAGPGGPGGVGPGGPVAGARVLAIALVGGSAYLASSAATDSAGHAHLARIPEGETWLLVDAPGWARASSHAFLTRGTRLVALELVPEHVLDIAVRDDQGKPLPGAEIEVQSADPLPVGARTDDQGVAKVRRLLPSPWIVNTGAPGYESFTRRSVRDGELLSITLHRLGAIRVAVVGEDEKPVSATVVIAGSELWPARSVETDGDGHATIAALPSGSYALRATSGDRVSPIELGVTLGRGEQKEVALRLTAGRFVSVRVADGDAPDASPIPAARVSIAETGVSPFPFEGTTDRDGRVRLGPLAPGPALLSARADGFVPRGLANVPESGGPVLVVLIHAGALSGRVVDARGFPVDGASIEIVGSDPAGAPIDDDPRRAELREAHFDSALKPPRPLIPSGELGVVPGPVPPIPRGFFRASSGGVPAMSLAEPWVTRSDGTFRASPVTPGRVRALVRHPQFVESVSDVVTLAPGGEAEVQVVLRAGGAVEGRVVDVHGRPVSGARVSVASVRGSLERTTLAASDGTFAFASLPEAVTLTAFPSTAPSELSAHAALTIPEGGKATVTMTLPEARSTLVVRVKDDRGYPLDAVQLTVTSLDPALPLRTTSFTDVRGEASIANAGGLPLRLLARAPGHGMKIVSVDVGTESLDLVLDIGETLLGEVWSTRGQVLPDADVAITTDVGVSHARTDKGGAFTVPDLAVGGARLLVQASGYAPHTEEIAIEASSSHRTTLARIELSEEGAVEGNVVDGRGDPVPGARVAKDFVPTYLALGPTPQGIAVADARGRFRLGGLPAGVLRLEAYAPDVGRAAVDGVRVEAGHPTVGVRIRLQKDEDESSQEPASSGGVAVTLGASSQDSREVMLADVAQGSEAERAGLVAGDVLLTIDGTPVHSMPEARARLAGPLGDDVVIQFRRGEGIDSVRVAREPVRK